MVARIQSADRLEFSNNELVFHEVTDSGFLVFTPAVHEFAFIKASCRGYFPSELFTLCFRNSVDHREVRVRPVVVSWSLVAVGHSGVLRHDVANFLFAPFRHFPHDHGVR